MHSPLSLCSSQVFNSKLVDLMVCYVQNDCYHYRGSRTPSDKYKRYVPVNIPGSESKQWGWWECRECSSFHLHQTQLFLRHFFGDNFYNALFLRSNDNGVTDLPLGCDKKLAPMFIVGTWLSNANCRTWLGFSRRGSFVFVVKTKSHSPPLISAPTLWFSQYLHTVCLLPILHPCVKINRASMDFQSQWSNHILQISVLLSFPGSQTDTKSWHFQHL